MNTSHTPVNTSAADRFARRITARLSEGASDLPYDISERLRASRMQALARRKKFVAVVHTAPSVVQVGHSATLGRGGSRSCRPFPSWRCWPAWWSSTLIWTKSA